MNRSQISPDDPLLTAFALGELEPDEAARFSAAIAGDPKALAAVEDIRALAHQLESALEDEPVLSGESLSVHAATQGGQESKVIRFSFGWAAGLAAAGLAAFLAVKGPFDHQANGRVVASAEEIAPGKPSNSETAPAGMEGLQNAAGSAESLSADARLASVTGRNRYLSPLMDYGLSSEKSGQERSPFGYTQPPAHGFLGVAGFPVSTFPALVGTGSYANVRRFLRNGRLPPPDAVRVEEMLNYFSYGSIAPRDGNPLAASLEVAAAPWNPSHRLVRIGLKGRDLSEIKSQEGLNPTIVEGKGAPVVAVAKDVKLQVEFNPEQAKSYRLIGYEDNRSGEGKAASGTELPAGHMITALYEVVPVGVEEAPAPEGDALRYASAEGRFANSSDPRYRELLTLKVHYKLPTVEVSRKLEIPLIDTGADFSVASKDFKFAAAVAGLGMLLTESPHKGTVTYDKVLTWAEEGQDTQDQSGKRSEFIDLVKKAKDAAVVE